jgi:hypothetical protein
MGSVAHEVVRKGYKILVGNPKDDRPLRRPRHRMEDNIKTEIR